MSCEPGITIDPYDMGRWLAVAMRVDNTLVQGADLEGLGCRQLVAGGSVAATKVKENIRGGNMAAMWVSLQMFQRHITLVMQEAYNKARALAVTYPQCILIMELCAGRDQQVCQLPVMFEQMTKVFTDAATQPGDTWLLGCWDSFTKGRGEEHRNGGGPRRDNAARTGGAGRQRWELWGKGRPRGRGIGWRGCGADKGGGGFARGAVHAGHNPRRGGGAGGAGGSGGGGSGAGAGPGPTAEANRLIIQKHAPV